MTDPQTDPDTSTIKATTMVTNKAGSTTMTGKEKASRCSPKNNKFTRASGLPENLPGIPSSGFKLMNPNQSTKKSGLVV
jgi:hypothetical protein